MNFQSVRKNALLVFLCCSVLVLASFEAFGQTQTRTPTYPSPYDASGQNQTRTPSTLSPYDSTGQSQTRTPSYSTPIRPSDRTQTKGAGVAGDFQKSYYERLSDTEKTRFFLRLNDPDRIKFFFSLSDAEKVRLFASLSEQEQMKFLWLLNNGDRAKFFSLLNDEEKALFFSRMKEPEKKFFFMSLNNRDKRIIFDSLNDEEKKRWVEEYPEIEAFAAGKEIAPRPFEKPSARPFEEKEKIRRPSDIEQIMSGEFPEDISRELKQFGYEFFERDPLGFQTVMAGPVGPDYVIGPDDGFTINLWGKAEGTYEVIVARDGSITLPRVGTLVVGGLTFAELKQVLLKQFKGYYPEFDMSITMGKLRTVDVFVVGEARYPGAYSLSSLSTVITALAAAGGPTKRGSLRNVQLSRGAGVARTLDLYEFFIKGNRSNDPRLQQGDTIFIPVVGSVAGIAGCVKRPAVYEIKGHESIEDLIQLAGGILPIGHTQNIVIERVKGHERRVVTSFNLDPVNLKSDTNLKIPVKDFDVVKVFPVHKVLEKVVYLEGHVKYPREYELKPGMKLRDLVPSYDGLLPEPHRAQAEIVRLVPPDQHPEIIEFNLGALLSGDETQNLALQEKDRIIIYDAWEKQQKPVVTVKGSVRNPGTYRLYQGMTVKDLIFQAGNLTDRAFTESASLSRVVPGERGTDTIKMDFSLRKAMVGDPQDNLLLKKDDSLYIRDLPLYNQALERKVFLEGEFVFAGEYSFSEGERIDSVIKRAQGLTKDAYANGAVFQRESVKKVQEEQMKRYVEKLEEDILTLGAQAADTSLDKEQAAILAQTMTTKKQLIEKLRTAKPTGRMVINLPEALASPKSEFNMVLRAGDRLIVNQKPDSVNVMGDVYNPTAVLFVEGKTVGDYLAMVGGPMETADEDQIYVVRANGSVISKKQGGSYSMASWDSRNSRWTLGGFDSIPLDPGDTVIVPKKVETYPWLRVVKDVTQIIFQIAAAAGVFIAAGN